MILDFKVVGGTVFTPSGPVEGDIGIRKECIVAIANPGELPDAREEYNARGKVVLPGIIDIHTHFREPGYEHKEDITTATQAAAAGGVTVCAGMTNIKPTPNTAERYRELLDLMRGKICVDAAHWCGPPLDLQELPSILEAGAIGVKVFQIKDTQRGYPHMPEIGISDDGHLLEIFKAVAEAKTMVAVHPHNQELMDHIERTYFLGKGKTGPLDYARAPRMFDYLVVNMATHNLLMMNEVTGAKLLILHVNSKKVIQWIREAKSQGREVYGEVNPRAVRLTSQDYERWGPYALGRWTPEEEHPHIWEGLNDGTLDIIGTDHAPHTREEKEIGWTNMWKAAGGAPELEHFLPMLLDHVNKGVTTLKTLVRVCCENPAKMLGYYPRKGAIQIGSDADLTICDMNLQKTITSEGLYTKCGWTNYEGKTYKGFPVVTILRGQVVMRDRKVFAGPGTGKVLKGNYRFS
ncbi:dihydroorotase family protein [Thermodesulfobacteriota bacterium]